SLAQLRYDDSFVRTLPADPLRENRVRQVRGAAYSRVDPTPVRAPSLLAHAPAVACLLGLSPAAAEAPEFAEVLGGNRVLPGMQPYAACYGGHQFGRWAGQLGDGRAITLGEVLTPDGGRLELQLKGAGLTPYSRTADGRAVLRSSLREFVCSEAMFHLGVPTTRALSLVTTGEPVLRDLLYNGNARHEPGAVVCRVAPSFVRFGNFELFASREEHNLLRALADYVITTHYPELIPAGARGALAADTYAAWFQQIVQRTADVMVHWLRVGFVHGVMNTDNMSILGLTIDYGPYGFIEPYDPDWTPNITDAGGRRYRFGTQPQVGLWNLVRLAEAILPLVGETEPLERALNGYGERVERGLASMYAQKLGLSALHTEPRAEGLSSDQQLLDDALALLTAHELDMTLFFRKLAQVGSDAPLDAAAAGRLFAPAFYAEPPGGEALQALAGWLERYTARARVDGVSDGERAVRMDAVNPLYVPRNYLAQQAIDAAEAGDASVTLEWLEVLRRPYQEQPGKERFAQKRPEWARHKPGCSMLSCSS
ncbi:MAG TPA: YdiU family protein, partial [Polyangiales bacterium]